MICTGLIFYSFIGSISAQTPIARWNLNSAKNGVLQDQSVNMLHGTFYGSPVLEAGVQGSSVSFDGLDDFAVIPNLTNSPPNIISSLTRGTISLWIKYKGITNGTTNAEILPAFHFGEMDLSNSNAGKNNFVSIYISHGELSNPSKRQLYFTVKRNSRVTLCFDTKNISLVANTWYHYVVTVKEDMHTAYLNGVEFERSYNAATNSSSYGFFNSVLNPATLKLGRGSFGVTGKWWNFNGNIDEVMIFDQYLTSQQVLDLYNNQITSIENKDERIPTGYELKQNYPNPFNPTTTIKYSLPRQSYVQLKVFNTLGEHVSTLIDREMDAGEHSVIFDAKDLPSGVYIFSLKTKEFQNRIKALLIK